MISPRPHRNPLETTPGGLFVSRSNRRTLTCNDVTSARDGRMWRLAEMASVRTLFLTPLLSPIGYDAAGDPVWPALGGRSGNNGMEFLVDDLDEETDDFDEEEDEEDDDPRARRSRPDDDEDDEPDDDEDEDDPRARRRRPQQRDEGEEDDLWEPPTREQWAKVEAALARNNSENRKRRQIGKIMQRLGVTDEAEFSDWLLERGLDPDSGMPLVGEEGQQRHNARPDDDGETEGDGKRTREQIVLDRRRAEERGAARTAAQYRPAIVQFAAAAALKDAGYSGKNISMALRLLNTDEVEVEFDDNGEPVVYGLDDQVKVIKTDFPELFAPKRAARRRDEEDDDEEEERPARRRGTARRVGGAKAVDGGERGRPPAKALGWLEKADRQMRGLPINPTRTRR